MTSPRRKKPANGERVGVVVSVNDLIQVIRTLNAKVEILGAELKALQKHLRATPEMKNGPPLPPLPTRPES